MEHFHVVASNQLPQDVMHARLEGFSSRPSNYVMASNQLPQDVMHTTLEGFSSRPSNYAAFVMYVTSFVPTHKSLGTGPKTSV